MFRTNQIISATELLRNFKRYSWHLDTYPEALLITQKTRGHLVLVNAEIYEELMELKFQMTDSTFNAHTKLIPQPQV